MLTWSWVRIPVNKYIVSEVSGVSLELRSPCPERCSLCRQLVALLREAVYIWWNPTYSEVAPSIFKTDLTPVSCRKGMGGRWNQLSILEVNIHSKFSNRGMWEASKSKSSPRAYFPIRELARASTSLWTTLPDTNAHKLFDIQTPHLKLCSFPGLSVCTRQRTRQTPVFFRVQFQHPPKRSACSWQSLATPCTCRWTAMLSEEWSRLIARWQFR